MEGVNRKQKNRFFESKSGRLMEPSAYSKTVLNYSGSSSLLSSAFASSKRRGGNLSKCDRTWTSSLALNGFVVAEGIRDCHLPDLLRGAGSRNPEINPAHHDWRLEEGFESDSIPHFRVESRQIAAHQLFNFRHFG